MKLVGITSCVSGIATTYMAAENLLRAAFQLEIDLKIEMQGHFGVENELTSKDIEEADGVIIAADTEIDVSRFAGKRLLKVDVQDGIRIPKEIIKQFKNNTVSVLN